MAGLRAATRADMPRIHEIRMAVRENRLTRPELVTPADVEGFIARGDLWVWQDADGGIAGFSAADSRDGTIWALFVDPAREGRGIGGALIARACRWLREKGYGQARLGTEPGTRAEAFYRRQGWRAEGLDDRGEMRFSKVL